MHTEILKDVGFTEAETKIYVALVELGTSTAAPILEKTALQNSVLYRTIHQLVKKGFVSYIKKGKIKHYQAADPQTLLTHLKQKQNELKEVVIELKAKQQIIEKEEAEVYSGFKGVRTMLYSLIEDAKEGEKFYFFGARPDIYKQLQQRIFLAYDQLRKEKGLQVYGLLNIAVKKQVIQKRYPQIKYVSFPFPAHMAIFKDKIATAMWGDLTNPKGVLITSKEIAKQYRDFFEALWKEAK